MHVGGLCLHVVGLPRCNCWVDNRGWLTFIFIRSGSCKAPPHGFCWKLCMFSHKKNKSSPEMVIAPLKLPIAFYRSQRIDSHEGKNHAPASIDIPPALFTLPMLTSSTQARSCRLQQPSVRQKRCSRCVSEYFSAKIIRGYRLSCNCWRERRCMFKSYWSTNFLANTIFSSC